MDFFIKQAIELDHIPENTDTLALRLVYEVATQHKWSAAKFEIYENTKKFNNVSCTAP